MPDLRPSPMARAALIEALIADGTPVAGASEEDLSWANELLAGAGKPQGWDPETVAPAWRAPLAWAGVPFARGGERWEVAESADLLRPSLSADGVLVLPPLAVFTALSSLPLKPLRVWVAQRFAVRVQIGTGVRLWLWDNRFVVLNCSDRHRGGFIHGPTRGMRAVVALDPGQAQAVSW